MAVSMDRWRGKVAVVTGASAGIGAAVAEKLVEEGVKVVGLARRVERVEQLAKKLEGKKGKLYACGVDLTNPDDIIKGFKWIKDNVGPIHILINNAGLGSNTSLINGDITRWKAILDTNVLGLCVSTREALKSIEENNIDGHIIHINSLGGHRVPLMPRMSVYCASKYAVTALTETLRNELAAIASKTKITSLSPGYVRSEFVESSGIIPDAKLKAYLAQSGQTPEDLANHVIYILSTPPHVMIRELKVGSLGENVAMQGDKSK